MEEIIIRETRPEDYEAFKGIYARCMYTGGTGEIAHEEPFSKKTFEEECGISIIVAEMNGQIVGYTRIYATTASDNVEVIKIDEMFTDICVRGKGVARQMLNFLENEVRGSEYNNIDLVSVSMETDRIWERMGFKSINYTEHYRKTV